MNKLDERLLTNLPPFRSPPRPQIREILDAAQIARYDERQQVFAEGTPVDRFFSVAGRASARSAQHGARRRDHLAVLCAGPIVRHRCGAWPQNYPATAVAAGEWFVLAWPNRLWPEFTARYDGFATHTYAVVGARLQDMHGVIVEIAT